MAKLDQDFESIKNEIYEHMLNTRGDKYKWFLRGLRSFKYLSLSPTKGTFLESYYTLMRYIDDVVDGDAPLPKDFRNTEEFVLQKVDFAENQKNPKDKVDYLILYCFDLGQRFGQEFTQETKDILNSMLFDARRYGKSKLFNKDELEQHFFLLDVRGTISATLKVFGEDPSKYNLLKSLGFATRIYYNLRDYDEDIRVGIVNISIESYEKFGIVNLEDRLSSQVQNWMKDQAQQGLELIQEHRKNLEKSDLGILARLTLPIVYEKPSRKYFESVLQKE